MQPKLIRLIALILVLLSLAIQIFAQSKTLDEFNSADGWKIFNSEGVDIKISLADGHKGKSIRIDYDFTNGSGYGGIQKVIPITYPENYSFSFYIKAKSPNNNLEFKIADDSGENVWWYNNRNYEFPTQWQKYLIKKRKIEFAWGTTQDKTLKKSSRLEFTIASYNGGKGTIYLDELRFDENEPVMNEPIVPKIISSTIDGPDEINKLIDNNFETIRRSSNTDKEDIIIDLGGRKEFGGLKINWDEINYAKKLSVHISDDLMSWENVLSVQKENAGTSYLRLPEMEAAFIKLSLEESSHKNGIGIKEIKILDGEYSADINRFLINIAKDYPRGYYPRYFYEEKSYWNVVGVNSDIKEALINEEGMVEVDKLNFSLEPFLFVDDKLQSWNDHTITQSLEDEYLPIPIVKWHGDLQLEIKAFADGEANKSSALYLIYTLKNNLSQKKDGHFYIALRPFQVNPYYQWLNITGGAAKIKSVKADRNKIIVNGEKTVFAVSQPEAVGVSSFDDGNIVSMLAENIMPQKKNIEDKTGFASGVMKYSFSLQPNEEKKIYVAVPFYNVNSETLDSDEHSINQKLESVKKYWDEKISYVKYNLPESANKIINTIRTNLANILVNRDNVGIQPGSRSYERSWIRDGALTSSALLKNGIINEVKEFADWYAANQFENGKVPCVVDRRGPDPVPENDSHGEFIYLIKQYFNYTKDTTWLRGKYENVKRTVEYLKYLIDSRSTEYYKNSGDSILSYYGILPESISHEGYSDKPRHSFWDSFWGMKGLKDAVDIAELVGTEAEIIQFKNIRDEFKINLYNSIRLTTELHKINYLPGCVELGDFDATSTTIALYPCNERENLPAALLQNTFDKYWEFTQNRALPKTNWDAYTPYEVRTIGSFIFLDQPERAHWLIKYFLNDQRPQGWNHWAEVVWKDKRLPRFIGDMPHTWVGSDFINSMRAMFVYENEFDSSLVIGAGLFQEWIDSPNGMSIEHLPTYYGELSYSIQKSNSNYNIKISGDIELPAGGIVIANFNEKKNPKSVIINGKNSIDYKSDRIFIKQFPAEIQITY